MTKFGEWQPIETAPKDGTLVILCRHQYQPVSGKWIWSNQLNTTRDLDELHGGAWVAFDPEGVFDSDHELADYLLDTEWQPTHWMPIPEPPQ